MTWQVELSKEASKFCIHNHILGTEIIDDFRKTIIKLSGEKINIDIKRLKGKWQGFYRLRIGKKRYIFEIDYDKQIFYLDRIDFRGNVYK